jgi:hypothetical protein
MCIRDRLPVDSFVAFPAMDTSRIVFTTDGFGADSSLVLATETYGQSPGTPSPSPTSAPGCTLLNVLAACTLASVVIMIRKK